MDVAPADGPFVSLSSWRAWIEIAFALQPFRMWKSLSSWRAWIEMGRPVRLYERSASLSSWRAWIEIVGRVVGCELHESLSSWRAWIEIRGPGLGLPDGGRSPHGERGLKSRRDHRNPAGSEGRSPHGERGLKLSDRNDMYLMKTSLSSWRAWIEMFQICAFVVIILSSLSSWRAWIEIPTPEPRHTAHQSLSSWRAWIEIGIACPI